MQTGTLCLRTTLLGLQGYQDAWGISSNRESGDGYCDILAATNRPESLDPAQSLLENREKLDEISQYLYQKETITGEEFMKILNS